MMTSFYYIEQNSQRNVPRDISFFSSQSYLWLRSIFLEQMWPSSLTQSYPLLYNSSSDGECLKTMPNGSSIGVETSGHRSSIGVETSGHRSPIGVESSGHRSSIGVESSGLETTPACNHSQLGSSMLRKRK